MVLVHLIYRLAIITQISKWAFKSGQLSSQIFGDFLSSSDSLFIVARLFVYSLEHIIKSWTKQSVVTMVLGMFLILSKPFIMEEIFLN